MTLENAGDKIKHLFERVAMLPVDHRDPAETGKVSVPPGCLKELEDLVTTGASDSFEPDAEPWGWQSPRSAVIIKHTFFEHPFETNRGALVSAMTTAAAADLEAAWSLEGQTRTPTKRRLRPGRRDRSRGPGVGPRARPARPVDAPTLPARAALAARSCAASADAVGSDSLARTTSRWRLTDRGIVMILVAGFMVVVAAVTVVGLTALRVTGGDAQPLTSTLVLAP